MGVLLIWLIAGILFFLSLWTVIPAFNFSLLPLTVAVAEISPLLCLVSATLLIILHWLKRYPPRLLLALLIISLILTSLPLLRLPFAVSKANQSMAQTFPTRASSVSTPPFSLTTFFSGLFGIAESTPQSPQHSPVRHQSQIPFAAPAETPLFLDLYQPPLANNEAAGTQRYPTVVMIYGGGWSNGSSTDNESLGRWLAAKGYVVVAIDYRHTPDFRFPAQIEDVKTALSFVLDRADEYEIARDRISLIGWSAGAQLAMLAGFEADSPFTDSIKSLISFYGPVNLAAGYSDPPKPDPLDVKQVLLAYLGGTPDELPDAYAAASPITYVQAAEPDALPPTLLVYGGRDHIVEARFGQYLYEQIIQSGNQAVWAKIPWAEHSFDKVFYGVGNQMALHFLERFLAQTL
ncbi:MAG: alpha/beta hydrolase [Cyanobacteria bacterium J06643_4]